MKRKRKSPKSKRPPDTRIMKRLFSWSYLRRRTSNAY